MEDTYPFTTVDELAKCWIAAQERVADVGVEKLDDERWSAIEAVHELSGWYESTKETRDTLWEFIQAVHKLQPNENVLGMLGAGPLENLITYWGSEYIDAIEAFAKKHPNFKKMMQGVWFSSDEAKTYSSVEVYKRFFEIAGCEPNFP